MAGMARAHCLRPATLMTCTHPQPTCPIRSLRQSWHCGSSGNQSSSSNTGPSSSSSRLAHPSLLLQHRLVAACLDDQPEQLEQVHCLAVELLGLQGRVGRRMAGSGQQVMSVGMQGNGQIKAVPGKPMQTCCRSAVPPPISRTEASSWRLFMNFFHTWHESMRG